MPVLIYSIQPGFRLVTGGDLNQMIEAINGAFSDVVNVDTIGQPNGLATLDENGVLSAGQVPEPTDTARGGVLQQAAIPDITGAPAEADFNGLLAALRSAGVISV